jgi:hypothetical protein
MLTGVVCLYKYQLGFLMDPHRPPYASATCETHRNVGPRGVHGCVTLEFERALQFRFTSSVTWPEGDDYDLIVENAVRDALNQIESEHTFACHLVSMRWHSIDSCQAGFVFASHHATYAALEPIK